MTFRTAPDFHYSNFPVYITYSWTFDRVDIGTRLSFLTPVEFSSWSFNPGMPVLIRLGKARIDTGLFVPILTNDGGSAGLNIPVRGTLNLGPRWFVSLETGLYDAAFGAADSVSSPLSGALGYTTFLGSRIVDVTARFNWDQFLHYSPIDGQKAVDASTYSIFFGASFFSKVM